LDKCTKIFQVIYPSTINLLTVLTDFVFMLSSVNGGYSEWSIWTGCSVTCGDGTKSRGRICDNPEPQHGGLDCSEQPELGNDTETVSCTMSPCPGKEYTCFLYFCKNRK